MTTIKIDEIEKFSENITLEGHTSDRELNGYVIERSRFKKMGCGRINIINSKITQSTFENCYLRNATFHNSDFTGTKFINCNLEKTHFRICNLNYVEFSKCKLNIDEILGNLPSQSNLKIALLKQLVINQNEMHDTKSSDKLLLMIAEEEKRDLKNKFSNKNSYYKNISPQERLVSLFHFILHSLSGFIWGYGLKLSRLFRFAILSILLFSWCSWLFKLQFVDTLNSGKIVTLNFKDSLIYSFLVFTNNGYWDYVPHGYFSKVMFILQSSIGIIFLGFLISAIYRRIAR